MTYFSGLFSWFNKAPVAKSDCYWVKEDSTLTVSAKYGVLDNDCDLDLNFFDKLSSVLVSTTSNGTLKLNKDGSFTYVPNKDFSGTDSFTYKAWDGKAFSKVTTVYINVKPVNDAPEANDDSLTTPFGATLTIDPSVLLANDTDVDGDALTISSIDNVVGGTLSIVAGKIVFVPADGFSGNASFTYTLVDSKGASDTATVTILVEEPVNTTPVANDDMLEAFCGTRIFLTTDELLANDSDADGDTLTIVAVGDPVNGTVHLNGNEINFNPKNGFLGIASFTYTVDDGKGGLTTATVFVEVTEKPPIFGTDGDDRINGDACDEQIFGLAGDDVLIGNNGNDLIYGGEGDDQLFGADGTDKLYGGAGDDNIQGGPLTDELFGEEGDDRLSGGDDDDIIVGGMGADRMIGNGGADTFVFNAIEELGIGGDSDIIQSFQAGSDKLDFSALNITADQLIFVPGTPGFPNVSYIQIDLDPGTPGIDGEIQFNGPTPPTLADIIL